MQACDYPTLVELCKEVTACRLVNFFPSEFTVLARLNYMFGNLSEAQRKIDPVQVLKVTFLLDTPSLIVPHY